MKKIFHHLFFFFFRKSWYLHSVLFGLEFISVKSWRASYGQAEKTCDTFCTCWPHRPIPKDNVKRLVFIDVPNKKNALKSPFGLTWLSLFKMPKSNKNWTTLLYNNNNKKERRNISKEKINICTQWVETWATIVTNAKNSADKLDLNFWIDSLVSLRLALSRRHRRQTNIYIQRRI